MKVSCQACGAKYTIADDKVRGRKVKIRCKSCGAPIVVDAQSEAPAPADQATGGNAPGAAVAPPAAAAPAAAAKNETWSVNLSDTDQRNMTTEEIIAGWKSGEVTNDAFVWKDGMGDWVAILECEELRGVLPAASDAAPDATATPFGPTIVTAPVPGTPKGLPAARVTGGRARGGVDLFDAVEGGAEDEVATSAPAFPGMAGTQPYDDGKMTGARNENSVLFSLDALKGGLPAAEPKKKSAPARDVASDPLVASPVSALGGGGSPLFSLSADQALLTAPAPPDPPPRAVETGEGRRAPNKLVIYGAAGAATLALLGIGVLLGQSGKDEATAEAAASASAAAEKKAADAKEEEKKQEKKKEAEEKKQEAKTEASASPAPSASVAEKKGTLGPPSDKKTTTPTTTATPTPAATEKKEEAAPAAGTAPFSVSAAQVALTTAASNAAGCKKPDGPTGSGKVKVTFATSGRVTSAVVDGPPFAGTPVGGCVAGMFRRAKVPPFASAGGSVTVSKSFSIK